MEKFKWTNAGEAPPPKNGRYIVYADYYGIFPKEVFDLWYEDGVWYVDKESEPFDFNVTHWMMMPEPPVESTSHKQQKNDFKE